MGQGYSLTTLSAGSAGIDVPELADLTYEKSLGDARFMKTVRARHKDGLVTVKVVMKPYSSMRFDKHIAKIMLERKILDTIPNALGYHRAIETSSNGFLARQYIYSSIYDRMSTRPFLEDIEKRWLAFQLLCAVRDCHSKELYHGDIKTENTLVTSWNWLYLSDFSSSFKPVFLPEDNPADFSFFFDISGRRTCYLAPERFYGPNEKPQGREEVTWAMDIFSAGCVIAELFLETPIFTLSQLFNYRKGDYDPVQIHLERIEDDDIRDLISHMIQIEPESRYSADEYLNFWRLKAFPEYFYSFLHQYMSVITDPTSGRSPITAGSVNLGESDARIDRVYFDFDKITYLLGHQSEENSIEIQQSAPSRDRQITPLDLDVPTWRQTINKRVAPLTDDGTLLFLTVVTSALRSTARATARIRACELLLAFSESVTDESKLDRVLPFVMALLQDKSEIVKVAAIRTATQLVSMVSTASPVNAYLFPEYILPKLEAFTSLASPKASPLVRATYAACVATLAEAATRFLDVVQALRAQGSMPASDLKSTDGATINAYQNLYDVARADLLRFFEAQTKALLTDGNPDVRLAFLGSVSSLCVFFGSAKANDVILSHLNTYLNDKDWRLKSGFFETIVGVAIYVGSTNLEEFILPLMTQALADPEEWVVEKVLRSLGTMAHLGLFQRSRAWELIDSTARFTVHPNMWIRESAASFLSATSRFTSMADFECLIKPILKTYLRIPIASMTETDLLDALKKPLSRGVLDMAISWANSSTQTKFWKPAQQRTLSMSDRGPPTSSVNLGPNALAKAPKSEEDIQWIARLKNAGMASEDEFKLVALREYIWRTAKRRSKEETLPNVARLKEVVALKDLHVDLKTVFFDHGQGISTEKSPESFNEKQPQQDLQTIASALLDASTTLETPLAMAAAPESAERGSAVVDTTLKSLPRAIKSTSPRLTSPLSSSPQLNNNVSQTSPPQNSSPASLAILSAGSTPETVHFQGRPSSHTVSLLKQERALQRKSSAMDLMQRKSSSAKANAATGTSSANAFGSLDHSNRNTPGKTLLFNTEKDRLASPPTFESQAAHSYAGRDPTVLKFLDSLYHENRIFQEYDFGPHVKSIKQKSWDKKPKWPTSDPWRPNGILIAQLMEHTAAVTRVVLSANHDFFITGSEDGSVRVWDTARLEQSLSHRSRCSYKHSSGSKVTALCFIQSRNSFVTCASDGTVHFVKLDTREVSAGILKYSRPETICVWQLPDHGTFGIWVEHYATEDDSTLLLATNTSRIVALNMKTMAVLYTLDNPVHHGYVTTFCLDDEQHWLLVGTSHGCLDLWDIRFQLLVRSWSLPGTAAPVDRIVLYPGVSSSRADSTLHTLQDLDQIYQKLVCVAGGTESGEISIWALEDFSCKHVYRASSVASASSNTDVVMPSMKPYVATNPDAASAGTMLKSFATSIDVDDITVPTSQNAGSLVVGLRDRNKKTGPILIAGSSDRQLRFWDLDKVERSLVISGLDVDEEQPRYETTSLPSRSCLFHEEKKKRRAETERQSDTDGIVRKGAAAQTAQRVAVIGERQKTLMGQHLDAILDVALVEYPFNMIISVDRSGAVYVHS